MKVTQDIVPNKEKASYFVANISQQLIQGVVGTFLLLFYVDVAGLSPAAVGTLFLVSRLMDAVSDPLSGFIIDHLPKSRWGRFRHWLLIGGIVTAINFWMIFAGPVLFPAAKLLVVYLTYLIFGIVVDFLIIPLISLIPVMTRDYNQRNQISTMRGMGMMVGFLIGGMLTLPIVNMFENEVTGWLVVSGIFAVIVIIVSWIGAVGVRERVQIAGDESYKLKDFKKILGNNRPLWVYFINFLLWNIGFNALGTSNVFYFKYNIGNEELVGPGLITMIFPMLIGALFVPMLGRKIDKKWLYIAGLTVMSVAAGARYLVPDPANHLAVVFILNILTGLGGAPTIPLPHAITADIVDFTEWKHHFRAEGVVGSITPFLSKAATGIGAALPGYVLAATGYVANVAPTENVLKGILFANATVPFIFGILGALAFIPYSLTEKRLNEIRLEVESRSANADPMVS